MVVNRHLAVQCFSYLDVLLLVVVDGLPIYLVIAKAVATALLHPIKYVGDAIVYVLVGVVILGCKETPYLPHFPYYHF